MTGMCYTRTCMGRLADETFVSLLFIVLLAFFDYNMDMEFDNVPLEIILFSDSEECDFTKSILVYDANCFKKWLVYKSAWGCAGTNGRKHFLGSN